MRFHGHGHGLPQFRLGAPRGDPRSHSRSAGASHTADLLPLSYTSRPYGQPGMRASFAPLCGQFTLQSSNTFIHKSLPLLGESSRLSKLAPPRLLHFLPLVWPSLVQRNDLHNNDPCPWTTALPPKPLPHPMEIL